MRRMSFKGFGIDLGGLQTGHRLNASAWRWLLVASVSSGAAWHLGEAAVRAGMSPAALAGMSSVGSCLAGVIGMTFGKKGKDDWAIPRGGMRRLILVWSLIAIPVMWAHADALNVVDGGLASASLLLAAPATFLASWLAGRLPVTWPQATAAVFGLAGSWLLFRPAVGSGMGWGVFLLVGAVLLLGVRNAIGMPAVRDWGTARSIFWAGALPLPVFAVWVVLEGGPGTGGAEFGLWYGLAAGVGISTGCRFFRLGRIQPGKRSQLWDHVGSSGVGSPVRRRTVFCGAMARDGFDDGRVVLDGAPGPPSGFLLSRRRSYDTRFRLRKGNSLPDRLSADMAPRRPDTPPAAPLEVPIPRTTTQAAAAKLA